MPQTVPASNKATAWTNRDWAIFGGLSLAALAAFFVGLGAFGLLDPSDGYYSEGAREMFESGNWLVPHLNYTWFFDKPIMDYWLIASSYKIFGVTEFASRVPAATCGALLVPGMFVFCRQFFRRRAALFAALALMSCPMWLILGHMSLTDMPLSFFIWVALGSFFSALEGKHLKLAWLGYVALGCGLLTKGPIALFLVAMNLAVYILLRRPSISVLWSIVIRLQVIPGVILSLAIAAPWYLLVNSDTRGAFFQEFFLNQNINRAMGTVDHKAGPLYYIPVLIGAAFPWTLISLTAARLWFNPFYQYIKNRLSNGVSLSCRCTTFGVTVAVATTLFFSLLPTKLVTYLLPVIPAIALVGGYSFDKMLRFKSAKINLAILAGILVLIGGAAEAVLLVYLSSAESTLFKGKAGLAIKELLAGDLFPKIVLCSGLAIMFLGALLSLVFIYIRKVRSASKTFLTAVVLSTVIAVPASIILSYQQKCRDMQNLVRLAREKKISPVMLGRRTPSATFYLGSKVKFLANPVELGTLLEEQPKLAAQSSSVYFLVHQNVYDELKQSGHKVLSVQQNGDWVLGSSR